MKTRRDGLSGKGILRILLCTGCLWFGLTIASVGQVNKSSSENDGIANAKPKQDFSIRVAVEEVRIDAVVVDKKGHQITDLTADDFDLYQDGKLQKIISSTYVNDYPARPARKTVPLDSSKAAPLISTPMLPRDKIRRTIVFVVDDLSMDLENLHFTRMSIQKFLESQTQPGDLVSIVRTSGGIGALQQFSSDKRQLLYAIKNLRWGAPQALTNCGTSG
jgi:VWFA-related protein